jgi:hypothetical protein
VRSKGLICRLVIAGIKGSNPAEAMDARLFCFLCGVHVAASAMS